MTSNTSRCDQDHGKPRRERVKSRFWAVLKRQAFRHEARV